MPITNGVYEPLTFDQALADVIATAPASLVFAPGNPPELVLANMFAESRVTVDESVGMALAALMSPVGAMLDLLNPNNPRQAAIATTGTIEMENATGAPIVVPPNTIFTASTGQQYLMGTSAITISAGQTAFVTVTCIETGIAGNIPAGVSFTAPGLTLTITNPIIWLSGADAETDSRYLQRVTIEKTEYGAQSGSVAAENELKNTYTAARMFINKSANALTAPVPVPGNGYNCVVLTPHGILENAAVMAQIFVILSARLEFVNSQNVSSKNSGNHITHRVLGGTVYDADVPQSYYYTAAQNVAAAITASIHVIYQPGTDVSEREAQAVDFATYFIERLMAFFSGVQGSTDITFIDSLSASSVTTVNIAASGGSGSIIAPTFAVAQIAALVSDSTTRTLTPQLMFESMDAFEIVLDSGVTGETPITLSLVSPQQFINFQSDALFSDGTSWFDRLMSLNPADILVTVTDVT